MPMNHYKFWMFSYISGLTVTFFHTILLTVLPSFSVHTLPLLVCDGRGLRNLSWSHSTIFFHPPNSSYTKNSYISDLWMKLVFFLMREERANSTFSHWIFTTVRLTERNWGPGRLNKLPVFTQTLSSRMGFASGLAQLQSPRASALEGLMAWEESPLPHGPSPGARSPATCAAGARPGTDAGTWGAGRKGKGLHTFPHPRGGAGLGAGSQPLALLRWAPTAQSAPGRVSPSRQLTAAERVPDLGPERSGLKTCLYHYFAP